MFIRIKGQRMHQNAHFDTQNFKKKTPQRGTARYPNSFPKGPLQTHPLPYTPPLTLLALLFSDPSPQNS